MKSNLAKSSEHLKNKYQIQMGHIGRYREKLSQLPGYIFVNKDGVVIAEYAGRRIVKFDHSFGQSEVLINDFEKPAGFQLVEEGLWLCGYHQKKMFFYKETGTGYQLEKELEFENHRPIWIQYEPSEKTCFIQAYHQQNAGSSLWKLKDSTLSCLNSWEHKKYRHLKVYDRYITLFDLSGESIYRLDFSGKVLEEIALEFDDNERISSAALDDRGNIFVISDNNYLYKFDGAGRLIFRSDLLLRPDSITAGGFNANIFCYGATLYSADIRNGNIITLNI